jgi:hypothetical protein
MYTNKWGTPYVSLLLLLDRRKIESVKDTVNCVLDLSGLEDNITGPRDNSTGPRDNWTHSVLYFPLSKCTIKGELPVLFNKVQSESERLSNPLATFIKQTFMRPFLFEVLCQRRLLDTQ